MVELEERRTATPAPPPARNWIVLWFTSLAGLTLIVAFVPWERWCSYGIDGFPRFCFAARMWSGSASLFGLLAAVLAAAFVGLSIGRRWTARERVAAPSLALATTIVTALGVKVTVVLVDSGLHHRAQSNTTQPQFVGVWLGLALVITAAVLLLMVLAGKQASPRSWVFAGVLIATLSLVGAAYAWSGLAWWGGPMANPMSLGGGNGEFATIEPGTPQIFQGLLSVANDGHLPATLDSVDLVAVTPGVEIGRTYVVGNCSGSVYPSALARCSEPVGGWVAHPGRQASDRLLAIAYRISSPGIYRVGWFRIRYHVGPLHFEIFRTDEFAICGLRPGQTHCHAPGF